MEADVLDTEEMKCSIETRQTSSLGDQIKQRQRSCATKSSFMTLPWRRSCMNGGDGMMRI